MVVRLDGVEFLFFNFIQIFQNDTHLTEIRVRVVYDIVVRQDWIFIIRCSKKLPFFTTTPRCKEIAIIFTDGDIFESIYKKVSGN